MLGVSVQFQPRCCGGPGIRRTGGWTVSWLFLAALAMIWAAFLLPAGRRKASLHRSVEDFERNMELLAETDSHGQGRWIITPRKGMAFIGPRARARTRARERRRRVFVFLLEAIGITFLMGLVPPLRTIWYATAALATLLAIYVWVLLSIRQRSPEVRARQRVQDANVPSQPRPPRQRYVAEGRIARQSFNGLGALGTDDVVNIVVRPAHEAGMARV